MLLPDCLRERIRCCSRACKHESMRKPPSVLTCAVCGVEYTVKDSPSHIFDVCSPKCGGTRRARRSRITPEPSPVAGARWVPLTRGEFALVDGDDYERVSMHAWQMLRGSKRTYAVGRFYENRTSRMIPMHRFLLNAPPEFEVDHINMNGLDNRKANLRLATHRQQKFNTVKRTNTTSKYKGVSAHRDRWTAVVMIDGVRHRCGRHATQEAAAKAYDAKARELFGPFARLNFPEYGEQSAHSE